MLIEAQNKRLVEIFEKPLFSFFKKKAAYELSYYHIGFCFRWNAKHIIVQHVQLL